jgi:hypothetical protein
MCAHVDPLCHATQALGLAAVKACACIVGIIAGGRLLIQPLYKKMSAFANAEVGGTRDASGAYMIPKVLHL